MAWFPSTYRSPIFREFKALDPQAFRDVIRFYEKYEPAIQQLDFAEYFELLVAYTRALFEIGAYRQHLLMADVVLETSIHFNIQYFQEEDIYRTVLFQKAASLYNTLQLEQAEYILRELLRMDPADQYASRFLKKCLHRQQGNLRKNSRAIAIFFFLLAALIIAIEVLMVRPFYAMHTRSVEFTRNLLFSLGLVALVGGDLLLRWQSTRKVHQFTDALRRQASHSR